MSQAADLRTPLGSAFTTRQAAEYLGLSMTKLRRIISRRQIRVLRAGDLVIYQRWCDDFIERHSTAVGDAVWPVRVDILATAAAHRPQGISDLMPARRRFPRPS